jgi:hypothetical protein
VEVMSQCMLRELLFVARRGHSVEMRDCAFCLYALDGRAEEATGLHECWRAPQSEIFCL